MSTPEPDNEPDAGPAELDPEAAADLAYDLDFEARAADTFLEADADAATPPDPGWLAADNEPDAGSWNTGLDGINLAAAPEPEAEAG
jgi:hypothetical protein